jgi:N-acetylneuraminic acid mutarotase
VLRIAVLLGIVACGKPQPPVPDAPVGPWTDGPALPGPRLEPGVTTLGDQLVMVGGFDTDVVHGLHITTEVDVLDPLTDTWSRLPDLPVQWTHINLAAIAGQLFVLGGTEGTAFIARGDAFTLDAGASSWRTLTPMPATMERGASAVIAAPPHILILGGAFTSDAVQTCLDYDISSDTWTQLADLPSPRSHPAGMKMSDGTIIIVGGLATLDATKPIADTIALPPGATMWESRAPSPIARGGCAYGVIGQSLICAGGEAGAAALHATTSYNPYQDVWTMLPDMPIERAGTQAAAIGQRLFVPGGANELQFIPTATMSVYDALDTAN